MLVLVPELGVGVVSAQLQVIGLVEVLDTLV